MARWAGALGGAFLGAAQGLQGLAQDKYLRQQMEAEERRRQEEERWRTFQMGIAGVVPEQLFEEEEVDASSLPLTVDRPILTPGDLAMATVTRKLPEGVSERDGKLYRQAPRTGGTHIPGVGWHYPDLSQAAQLARAAHEQTLGRDKARDTRADTVDAREFERESRRGYNLGKLAGVPGLPDEFDGGDYTHIPAFLNWQTTQGRESRLASQFEVKSMVDVERLKHEGLKLVLEYEKLGHSKQAAADKVVSDYAQTVAPYLEAQELGISYSEAVNRYRDQVYRTYKVGQYATPPGGGDEGTMAGTGMSHISSLLKQHDAESAAMSLQEYQDYMKRRGLWAMAEPPIPSEWREELKDWDGTTPIAIGAISDPAEREALRAWLRWRLLSLTATRGINR